MTTTWTVMVDWDRNANYTGAYDDISSRVIEAKWFLGMQKLYQSIADNSILTLTLNNSDGRFSPENVSSPLYGKLKPLRPVRVQYSTDGGVNWNPMWTGWVESYKPLPGKDGPRTVEITAIGPMKFYMDTEVSVALQVNQRSEQILTQLFRQVMQPPAVTMECLLDREGWCELCEVDANGKRISGGAILGGVYANWYDPIDNPTGTVVGRKTFAYVGDNWARNGGVGDDARRDGDPAGSQALSPGGG
jgi:hypothetical protein